MRRIMPSNNACLSDAFPTTSRFGLQCNQALAGIRLDDLLATAHLACQPDWRLMVDGSDPANCEGLDGDPNDTSTSLLVFAPDTAH